MTSAPGVTAVIPAFNAEPFVERAVLSALAQTYPQLKVLVIDDGSTDGTFAICQALAASHPNLRIHGQPNGGVAAARNRGVELADTPLIAFLDADDLWERTKIEKQVASLTAHGLGSEWAASYCYSRRIDHADRVIANARQVPATGDIFGEHLLYNHVGNGSSLLVRRDVALAAGGFDPTYRSNGVQGVEDYAFQLKLAQICKFDLVPEFLVGYREHPGCMSANHLSMGLGLIEVISRFAVDEAPGCPPRQTALAVAHLNAAMRFMQGNHWNRFRDSLAASFRLDRRRTASELATLMGRNVRSGADPSSSERLLRGAKRSFQEFEPEQVAADFPPRSTAMSPALRRVP